MSELNVSDLLVSAQTGEASGTHLDIKIRSGQLGGDFSVMQGVMHPHHLLAPHFHENEDQAVFVLNGELGFEIGGAGGLRFTAKQGDWVVKPRQVAHTFWNSTDEDVHYIELSGRDGFERFIDSTTEKGSVKASWQSVEEYDMTWHYDWIPRLMLTNRLRAIAGVEAPWEELKGKSPAEIVELLRERLTG